MEQDNFVFCIYGFLRDMKPHRVNMSDVDKFVYVPKRRYEDNDVEVTSTELEHRFGKKSCINAYEYDAKFFNDEFKKLNVEQFNFCYQQPQRILSFFKHIRDSLLMLKEDDRFDDDTIIFLFRSDMGIKEYDLQKSKELLRENDIIVERIHRGVVRDFWFVLKKKNISVFTSLYESYKTYLLNMKNNKSPKPRRANPESILYFHFNINNKKVIDCPVMKVDWRHVCNKYCGHNKGKTEILGES